MVIIKIKMKCLSLILYDIHMNIRKYVDRNNVRFRIINRRETAIS